MYRLVYGHENEELENRSFAYLSRFVRCNHFAPLRCWVRIWSTHKCAFNHRCDIPRNLIVPDYRRFSEYYGGNHVDGSNTHADQYWQ